MKKEMAQEKKQVEKVKLKNIHFELFDLANPASGPINRIKSAVKDGKARYELYKELKKITDSPECKAYQERKNEIVKQFNDDQKDKPDKERRPPTTDNMPEIKELWEMDSGLEVDKIEISNKMIGETVTTMDYCATDWLFEFTD